MEICGVGIGGDGRGMGMGWWKLDYFCVGVVEISVLFGKNRFGSE
jgi:hypothetical protein